MLVGDPSLLANTRKAAPGETIALFVDGLASSPAGIIISGPIPYSDPVTVTIAGEQSTIAFAGLTAAGEYQVNVQVPLDLPPGNHPISISTAGKTSMPGVTLSIGP